MRHLTRTGLVLFAFLATAATVRAQDTAMHGAMKDGMHDGMKAGMHDGMKDGAMAHGTFTKGTKGCTGSYTIGEDQGQQILTFSGDFSLENSPTPYVILSTSTGLGDAPVWLGAVQYAKGPQRYMIPKGTNLSEYKHVVIWDKTTNATLASADLASGGGMMSDK